MVASIVKNQLSDVEKNLYEKLNPGWTVECNDTLRIDNEGEITDYVIFMGAWTKLEMCRDCGEYFIIATSHGYLKVFKTDMRVVSVTIDE